MQKRDKCIMTNREWLYSLSDTELAEFTHDFKKCKCCFFQKVCKIELYCSSGISIWLNSLYNKKSENKSAF